MTKTPRRSRDAARAATAAPATQRPARRRTRPVARYEERGLLERYRGLLLGGFALLGAGIIAVLFLQAGNTQAYTCQSLLQPGASFPLQRPTPTGTPEVSAAPSGEPSGSPAVSGAPAASESPAASGSPAASPTGEPAPTQRVGFPTSDLGNTHVRTGSTVRYGHCPPTSGQHYNEVGQGPIPREFYTPERQPRPGGWIHNLEHGWVVALYSCRDGCPTSAELDELRSFFDSVPANESATACNVPNKVLVARFDEMSTKFAVVAWDVALLMDEWDGEQAQTFAQQWMDPPQAPETGIC